MEFSLHVEEDYFYLFKSKSISLYNNNFDLEKEYELEIESYLHPSHNILKINGNFVWLSYMRIHIIDLKKGLDTLNVNLQTKACCVWKDCLVYEKHNEITVYDISKKITILKVPNMHTNTTKHCMIVKEDILYIGYSRGIEKIDMNTSKSDFFHFQGTKVLNLFIDVNNDLICMMEDQGFVLNSETLAIKHSYFFGKNLGIENVSIYKDIISFNSYRGQTYLWYYNDNDRLFTFDGDFSRFLSNGNLLNFTKKEGKEVWEILCIPKFNMAKILRNFRNFDIIMFFV